MNTKEIIETLEDELSRASGWAEVYETEDFFNSIITLLKEGEKYKSLLNKSRIRNKVLEARVKGLKELEAYKQMWNEIATMYKLPCYGLENSEGLKIVKFLEQKYSPKGGDLSLLCQIQ